MFSILNSATSYQVAESVMQLFGDAGRVELFPDTHPSD